MELNTTYLGDCLEIMQRIPDKSIDMILCDLPYGTTQNKWDSIIDLPSLWSQYKRVIKDKGAIVLTASQPFTSVLVCSNLSMFKHEWVWLKNKGSNYLNVKREPMKEHESVVVFAGKNWTYNRQMEERSEAGKSRHDYGHNSQKKQSANYGKQPQKTYSLDKNLRVPRSYQKFNTVTCGKAKFKHPTQKPVVLFEYLIKTYTNPGELVLDNCAGSGTTGEACVNTGRNYIQIEKDPTYYEGILEREANLLL